MTATSTASNRVPITEAASGSAPAAGWLIVNADDWGLDARTTDIILRCALRKTVTSVSAMVFMEDSERAAAIARQRRVDTGLHLNFTAAFTAPHCPPSLRLQQQRLAAYLRRNRFSRLVFHPGLCRAFESVTAAQIAEYERLYGAPPNRIDGHHHMHLCANVLLQNLLPSGILVRRNFTFQPGEKGAANRAYRSMVDRMLGRRHRTTDYLFNLAPLASDRLDRILSLARDAVVELETHPVRPDEYRYLAGGPFLRQAGDTQLGSYSTLLRRTGVGLGAQ